MSSRLTRRAFFPLPVALPVAAVAAKVAPVKPFATGGVVGPARFAPIMDAREIAMRRYPLMPPGTYLVRAPIDFGQQAVTVARLVNGKAEMATAERADPAAEPVTAQAAAPVGNTKSCGGMKLSHAGGENIGDRLCAGRHPSPPPLYDRDGVRPATGEVPGPQDTIASVGV